MIPEDFRFRGGGFEAPNVFWTPKAGSYVVLPRKRPACPACFAFDCARGTGRERHTHTQMKNLRHVRLVKYPIDAALLWLVCATRQTWCHTALKDPGTFLPCRESMWVFS